MDDALNRDSLALGHNQSSSPHPGWNSNLSFPSLWGWATPGQPARTISATVIMLLGLVGNGLLLHRLRCGGCCCAGRFARRRKMDFLLAHLAVADLYGCGLALLSQLPPAADGDKGEPREAEWPTGDATCRLFRLLQGSGLLAPSHMLVLLALERHRMVRGPRRLQEPQPPPSSMPARGALAALGWLLTLLLALPQAFVYRLSPPQDGSRCLSVFAQLPPWHSQVYAVYGAITGFVAPACLLGGTCGRILSALSASRAKEEELCRAAGGSSRHRRVELPGVATASPLLLRLLPVAKCALPSPSAPRSLPRARARAFQLTLALATLFALCGFPRFVLELVLAFASPPSAAEEARTTLGSILAATNCALNPFVCLIFHSHRPWARRLQSSLCRCPEGQPRRRAPHRHRPPPLPQVAVERTGFWLCPCQTKPLTASAVVQQRKVEAEAQAAITGESGL